MKIVQPYAKIVTSVPIQMMNGSGPSELQTIEAAARISHRSEDGQTSESWERFLRAVVLERGDWSVVEHVSVSVEFLVDRGITHELVRHRLFSFTQESTRFVNYEKKMPPSFIYPGKEICAHCIKGNEPICVEAYINAPYTKWTHRWNRADMNADYQCNFAEEWLHGISECERAYKKLLLAGWRPQEARSVLPNALASKILMTGNVRNWRHFFQMRTCKEAHPQMRQVTIPLLIQFQTRFPILFEDIVPDEQQAKAIRKGR